MVTGCIVLYQNEREVLKNAIDSFLQSEQVEKLYLIDNSPTQELQDIVKSESVHYIHNPSNPGFGAAHNIALKLAIAEGSQFHFVVNPDVSFDENVIKSMIEYIQKNPDVGMMMPQILNEDGSVQNLPKLLPSPFSVLMRKLKKPTFYYNNFINNYELRFVPKSVIYNAPILSGCFTLLNLAAITEVGLYDDRFFMYFEDWDLSRRMHQKYKTIYFPEVSVTHGYESGANKNKRLFKIFVNSATSYFNKWGWFFDSERHKINKETISQFK